MPLHWRINLFQVPKKIILLLLFAVLALALAWIGWNFFFRPERRTIVAVVYRDIALSEARELSLRIETGDFFAGVLGRAGVETQEAAQLAADIRPAYDLAKIRSGQIMTIFFEAGKLRNLVYPIDRDTYLEAERDDQGRFRGRVIAIPYEVRREVIHIRIENSLYESTLACGEKLELFEPLSRIFEYDVDFNRDIQPGDLLSAILEKKYLNGKFSAYGDILAAELVNNGKIVRIVRYSSPSGSMSYYHPDGSSTRRQFLRCPLPFIRVTSRFGMRMHPVLGFSARHNGIDFGAPYGTPVRATSAGVMIGRGRDSDRGNYLIIRHGNGFISQYFHLSRFAKKLSSQQRVEQGQVVGYVGSTGLSTGPHLHYGLLKNGRFLNPLKLQSPTVAPLPKQAIGGFRKYCDQICLPLSQPQKLVPLKTIGINPWPLPSIRTSNREKTDFSGNGRDG
jgi:murein DD-endopeptidase MepM/ murein hydrolase activator NlpD